MSDQSNAKNQLVAWVLLVVLSLIWGSSFILIKKSLIGFSASEVGALRVIFASAFLIPFFFKNLKGLTKKELTYLFFVGLTGSFIPALLFAVAQTRINSSLAGLLNSLTPMSVLIIGILFYGQRIKLISFWGVILGLMGSVILIAGFSFAQFTSINYYALFVILATIMYGINLNLIKHRLLKVKSTQITIVSVCMVLPIALIYLFFFTPFASIVYREEAVWSLASVATLGVIGTGLALFLFNKMVKISSTIFSSSVTYLIPIIAIFWGMADGESIYLHQLIGLMVILLGIILINRRP